MTKEHYEAGDIVFCNWVEPYTSIRHGINIVWRGTVEVVYNNELRVNWYFPIESCSTIPKSMVYPGDDFEALVKRTARNAQR